MPGRSVRCSPVDIESALEEPDEDDGQEETCKVREWRAPVRLRTGCCYNSTNVSHSHITSRKKKSGPDQCLWSADSALAGSGGRDPMRTAPNSHLSYMNFTSLSDRDIPPTNIYAQARTAYPLFLLGGRAGPASLSTLLEACDSCEELEPAPRHSDWYWGGRGRRPLSASWGP